MGLRIVAADGRKLARGARLPAKPNFCEPAKREQPIITGFRPDRDVSRGNELFPRYPLIDNASRGNLENSAVQVSASRRDDGIGGWGEEGLIRLVTLRDLSLLCFDFKLILL